MQQLTAQKILTAFTFTIRYATSMMYTPLTMHNLTYTSQTRLGFHGVYPSCLHLALEEKALSVNFLDPVAAQACLRGTCQDL